VPEHADDGVGVVADGDLLAQRVVEAEEFAGEFLGEDGDVGDLLLVLVGEEGAAGDLEPVICDGTTFPCRCWP
jgi:hypothetical protein